MFQLKRAYEPASRTDGCRVLVERLWPRGVSKSQAAIDAWLKDVAPSSELRKWYGHDPARWDEFRRRYWAELRANCQAVDDLRAKERKGKVTLVYAARDQEHSGALALAEFLKQGKPQPLDGGRRKARAKP